MANNRVRKPKFLGKDAFGDWVYNAKRAYVSAFTGNDGAGIVIGKDRYILSAKQQASIVSELFRYGNVKMVGVKP
jgi:hypothetical protein